MNRKILSYIGVIVIGIGFIMMAARNVLNSETASSTQAVLGAIFIIAAVMKIILERRKDK